MIDNKNSQHENFINAHAVSVTQPDGSYKPLDEVLKELSAGGGTPTGKTIKSVSVRREE